MNGALAQVLTVFSMIIGVAIVSILVSKNANTAGVASSVFTGFSNALGVAEAPVTGASSSGTNILSSLGSMNF